MGASVPMSARLDGVDVGRELRGDRLVGQRLQQLLTVAQLHQMHVDAAVRDDPASHAEAQVAVDAAREELAADGVAEIVRQEVDLVDAQRGDDRLDRVGHREDRVRAVGLGREPEPRVVEEHDAALARQRTHTAAKSIDDVG